MYSVILFYYIQPDVFKHELIMDSVYCNITCLLLFYINHTIINSNVVKNSLLKENIIFV